MTRADLAPGIQACQAAHSALDFAFAYPAVAADWHDSSNTLVILTVRDELELSWLWQDAVAAGLTITSFREPDLDGALTAVALEPAGARLVRNLPLAFPPERLSSGRPAREAEGGEKHACIE